MDFLKFFINKPIIKNILQDKKSGLRSGYLFFSPDEKTNDCVLKCLATVLLCKNDGCFNCPDCVKVKEGTHPDLISYPVGNSFNVQDAKNIVIEATKKPMLCDIKIILINNIDNSSEEAQNKLLKTLEEPPKNVIFLVSTKNMDRVLPTVRSRLLKREIAPFDYQGLSQIFEEYNQKADFELALKHGNGYIGKTLDILCDDTFLDNYNLCKDIVTKLKSSNEVVNFLNYKLDKKNFKNILENLQSMYRDIMLIKANKWDIIINKNICENLKSVENEFSFDALVKIIQKINDANNKQFSNVSLTLIFESLLVGILEVKYLCR